MVFVQVQEISKTLIVTSNKLSCFNFLMQDSDLTTVHEWKNDKGRKQSLREVGKKVCLQLTFKREQKLEFPQELLSKYQPLNPQTQCVFPVPNSEFSIETYTLDKSQGVSSIKVSNLENESVYYRVKCSCVSRMYHIFPSSTTHQWYIGSDSTKTKGVVKVTTTIQNRVGFVRPT